MESERKDGIEHDFRVFGLSNWINKVSFTWEEAILDMFCVRCLLDI